MKKAKLIFMWVYCFIFAILSTILELLGRLFLWTSENLDKIAINVGAYLMDKLNIEEL